MSQTESFSLSASLAQRLKRDEIATCFERAWGQGVDPVLEDFLGDHSADADLLADLLAIEFAARLGRGERLHLEDYRRRFPRLGRRVKRVFLDHAIPQQLGAFPVVKALGSGGFGRVFLARDPRLDQFVALKVLTRDAAGDWDALLREAQMAARLRHEAIVRIHQVAEDDDGDLMLVMEYVDGESLQQRLKRGKLAPRQAVELALTICHALQHAHEQRVTHRDLKPANVLIGTDGKVLVADFGLAVLEEQQRREPRHVVGTLRYMAPEQAAGETHRIDGRTDVWAVGVSLYEMLTGTPPFAGNDRHELLEAVRLLEPRPLRQRNGDIPDDLQRIVLRCLEKRMDDRYLSAADLIQDLQWWLAQADAPRPTAERVPAIQAASVAHSPTTVVPKGLRSFDQDDAEFFCELLPGPRDRDGVPRSIRFWQRQLEGADALATPPVAVLYGPSGSGKSSFVKAGVLPLLSRNCDVVFVEATAQETEAQLLQRLAARFPQRSGGGPLADSFAAVRENSAERGAAKVVIVLDQFEQWLHAQASFDHVPLAEALRQCDGTHLQALLLVRDDFWQLLARLMHGLEVPLAEGCNSGTLDLFDRAHAQRVLTQFGRAFQRIPQEDHPDWPAAEHFIRQAIEALADGDRVVPVRLALFAEMFKGREWTAASLRSVGGAEGVGVWFLEETFSARTAPPEYRAMEAPTRRVLEHLLPPAGADLRGHRQSAMALAEAAGLADRPQEFARLIAVLDHNLRLITPADDRESNSVEDTAPRTLGRSYQLTHDYLVPSIRGWLNRRKRETARGRAELRLAERGDAYAREAHRRQLPGFWEWLGIETQAPPRTTNGQRALQASRRYYSKRLLGGIGAAAVILLVAWEGIGRLRAHGAVQALKTAQAAEIPAQVAALQPVARWARPMLAEITSSSPTLDSSEWWRAALGSYSLQGEGDEARLCAHLLAAEGPEVLAGRDVLARYGNKKTWSKRLKETVGAVGGDLTPLQMRALAVLPSFEPTTPLARDCSSQLVHSLVADAAANPGNYDPWLTVLREQRENCLAPLSALFGDAKRNESERHLAANMLAELLSERGDSERLIDLLVAAEGRQFLPILTAVRQRDTKDIEAHLNEVTLEAIPERASAEARDALARRRTNAAIALWVLFDKEDCWRQLAFTPDPRLRSYLIERLAEHLPSAEGLPRRYKEFGSDSESDRSIRQALLMIAGALPADRQGTFETSALLNIYESDADSGVHAAAEWALRRRGQQVALQDANLQLGRLEPMRDHEWYVTPTGITMIVFRAPGATVLGPRGEDEGEGDEVTCDVDLDYSFALSSCEITLRDVLERLPQLRRAASEESLGRVPASSVSWFEAAMFCRKLSADEGFSETQQCYPATLDAYRNGLTFPDDFQVRKGYRLPLECEWEVACRSGAATPRPHGSDLRLLGAYAWSTANSDGRLHDVGSLLPNRLGLFDMLGNAEEWCGNPYLDGVAQRSQDLSGNKVVPETRMSIRGGASIYQNSKLRSANRRHEAAGSSSANRGFRIAKTLIPH